MLDRAELWNTVEAIEKRKDAQLARELNIALPRELKPDQRLRLIRTYVREQFVALRMVADLAIHDDGTNHNPHAHVMLPLRQVTAWGFRSVKTREWNSREMLKHWREQWAVYANDALARAGHDIRIDHRTLKIQGINREPTIHEGPKARELAAKNYTAPKSRVRYRQGWRHRAWYRDYRLTDGGYSRVAYNRQIKLQNMRLQRLSRIARAAYASASAEPPLKAMSSQIYLAHRVVWTAQIRAQKSSAWLAKLQSSDRQRNSSGVPKSLAHWFAARRQKKKLGGLMDDARRQVVHYRAQAAFAQREIRALEAAKRDYSSQLRALKIRRDLRVPQRFRRLVNRSPGRELSSRSHQR